MKCGVCFEEKLVSKILGVCKDCITENFEKSYPYIEKAHETSRKKFNLPLKPPERGVRCGFCVNDCKVSDLGFCGVRGNQKGRVKDLGPYLDWYYDPLPTNCVAAEVCSAKNKKGKNLAVFYRGCSYDCLFCQNWQHKVRKKGVSSEELAELVDHDTFCICYFGGDPTPHFNHAIKTSKLALEKGVRICFETNGSMNKSLAKKIGKLVFKSGGTLKIDLKSFSEKLNIALCGVSNKNTLKNFKYLSKFSRKRKNFLVASTLLVPGYVDSKEVERIAKFISELNPEIPYVLLAFHPHYLMKDLPNTSENHAEECYSVAKKYLENVRIGNWWLLGKDYKV